MERSLLLEIGCEELPTSFVRSALDQLQRIVPEEFARTRVPHGTVRVLGTARRLAVHVAGVSAAIAASSEELTGPAESAARAKDGSWTKAAEGFAKKNGVSVDALRVIDTPKGRYVAATRTLPGGETLARLPEMLATVVGRIAFTKSMRWADIETPFGRPVQWLVALFGEEIVPLEFVGLRADRVTRGHRFLSAGAVNLLNADAYVAAMRDAHVFVEVDVRAAAQQTALESAARAAGGTLVSNPALADEVLGLVEEPFVVVGNFDSDFLSLPHELIETVMSHHQRYFAARGPDGRLLAKFLTVTNTAKDPDRIREGNERVMRARLADARFFVQQDRAERLASRVERLHGVVFHPKLGSYGDKVRRLERLAAPLAPLFGADPGRAARAALLAKADLVSLAVGEFPELQGIMGREYARHDGEPDDVAEALAEHYLPRGAEDSVARTPVGAVLAVADRLDTLVAFFAIGQKPSGGGDPFGLRRAALGILRTLLTHRARIELRAWFGATYDLLERDVSRSRDEVVTDLDAFVRERLEGMLVLRHPADVVRACIAAGSHDVVDVEDRVSALATFRNDPRFARMVTAFERVFNISRESPPGEADPAVLSLPAEQELFEVVGAVRPLLSELVRGARYADALALLAERLPGPVDRFFENVFVMDDDLSIRNARLRLLGRLADDVGAIARFDTLAAADRAGGERAQAHG